MIREDVIMLRFMKKISFVFTLSCTGITYNGFSEHQ